MSSMKRAAHQKYVKYAIEHGLLASTRRLRGQDIFALNARKNERCGRSVEQYKCQIGEDESCDTLQAFQK